MKRAYSKPVAVVENMLVSNFVATACSSDLSVNFYESTCSIYDPDTGFTYFSANCEAADPVGGLNIVNPNPQSPAAVICYHRPYDSAAFFGS